MKKYGLLGKTLTYSYSKIIHEYLFQEYNIAATYDLIETNEITAEMIKQYDGMNVTIPYKETITKFLVENNSPIHVCNTIIKNENDFIGYNTDIDGFQFLLEKINVQNIETVVILGNGATSKMCQAIFADKKLFVVSRGKTEYTSKDISKLTADLLINCTPVGMNEYNSLLSNEDVVNFRGIIDLNYNPINSKLAYQAQLAKIPFVNGLYMLIVQAVKAFEIWNDVTIPTTIIEKLYQYICFTAFDKVALIGMPFSGKTTMINKFSGYDLDDIIVASTGCTISELFEQNRFREEETAALKHAIEKELPLLALGGGTILKSENIELLKDYLLVFLDEPLEVLKKRVDFTTRPLIKQISDLETLYETRYPLYNQVANIAVSGGELEYYLKK
jgi:Shikimate 5-dehydrogenase